MAAFAAGPPTATAPYPARSMTELTIVTVTLNAGPTLLETVRSVASQDWHDYEHIIKDAGSSDGSTSDVGDFPRVRLYAQADTGIYDAMNQAIGLASGRWTLFLNAGDRLTHAHSLATVLSAAQEKDSLLYCDYVDGHVGGRVSYPSRLSPFFLYRSVLCHQACLLRTHVLREFGGFDTTLRIAADQDVIVRAIVRERLPHRHVPHPAVYYAGGGFSAAAGNRALLDAEWREVRRRYFDAATRRRYAFAWSLTLPAFRTAIMRSNASAWLRPYYARLVNAFNALGRRA